MFWWRDEREVGDWVVDLAFTDVEGGVSRGGCASLNLGAHVGDDPDAVAENRSRMARAFDADVADLRFMAQVHGAQVAVLDCDAAVSPPQPPTADGQVSAIFDDVLVVMVADCTPVLLYDTRHPLVAAVHAGRPGLIAGVIGETVAALRLAGAESLRAVVGPSVCGRCYEVPAAMRGQAAEASPASYAMSWAGTPAIDVAAGVVAQLGEHDVSVDWIAGCTREETRLFSHRRDPGAGRFAGLIRLRRGVA